MIALLVGLALAHPTSPSLLRLVEGDDGVVVVTWRTPDARAPGQAIAPLWPDCAPVGDPAPARFDREAGAIEVVRRFRCAALEGVEVGVAADDAGVALVEVVRPGGTQRAVVGGDRPRVTVAAAPDRGIVGMVRLGAAHLLGGWDHGLLVVGLALRLRGRPLVYALTAFTCGHAASLAAATIAGRGLASGWVEAAIAATLVAVLAEAAGPAPGPLARRPWALGVPVGVVHGLGFAGGLAELGVGRDGMAVGLLGFNLGLELAQLAVAAAALATLALVDRVGVGEGARRGVAWAGGIAAGALLAARLFG